VTDAAQHVNFSPDGNAIRLTCKQWHPRA
jgi:hypothetical protein